MEIICTADSTDGADTVADADRDDLITCLTNNPNICFKSQQRWEPDLNQEEKFQIALKLFHSNKLNFLLKFGRYLNREQLYYFQKFTDIQEPDSEEISLVLSDLHKNCSTSSSTTIIKNRRFGAMKKMIEDDNSYFSEIEMMKRNPLLYDHLVGQYLTADEVRDRDKYEMSEKTTFVNILMEGIERDNAELQRKQQEETEDTQIKVDSDSSDEEKDMRHSPVPSFSRWGEFETDKLHRPNHKKSKRLITPHERQLLKQEFVTSMYQDFLEGKDEQFDYGNVDTDKSFDLLDEIDNDAEEKYFESEQPADINMADCSSEDELDVYMNALNQDPKVLRLSNDLRKL